METITITFDKKGNPTIATEGFKGAGCKAATEELSRKLGQTTEDSETAEYFEQEVSDYATSKR